MKKSELISSIAKKYPFLKAAQVSEVIDIVFAQMVDALKNSKRIEIRGLGAFSLKSRKVQKSFPSGNKSESLVDRNTVYFRMGKEFFDRLNP
jgi:integration host factor subunit beta